MSFTTFPNIVSIHFLTVTHNPSAKKCSTKQNVMEFIGVTNSSTRNSIPSFSMKEVSAVEILHCICHINRRAIWKELISFDNYIDWVWLRKWIFKCWQYFWCICLEFLQLLAINTQPVSLVCFKFTVTFQLSNVKSINHFLQLWNVMKNMLKSLKTLTNSVMISA